MLDTLNMQVSFALYLFMRMKQPADRSKAQSSQRSPCPIASTLDILGDKWSLLIVRDMLRNNKKRYGEFLKSKEGIRTNILADRLRRLEAHGIVEKRQYRHNPIRFEYLLTRKGEDLNHMLDTIIDWGLQHLPDVALPPAN